MGGRRTTRWWGRTWSARIALQLFLLLLAFPAPTVGQERLPALPQQQANSACLPSNAPSLSSGRSWRLPVSPSPPPMREFGRQLSSSTRPSSAAREAERPKDSHINENDNDYEIIIEEFMKMLNVDLITMNVTSWGPYLKALHDLTREDGENNRLLAVQELHADYEKLAEIQMKTDELGYHGIWSAALAVEEGSGTRGGAAVVAPKHLQLTSPLVSPAPSSSLEGS